MSMPHRIIRAPDASRLTVQADQCVRCGLCLPHCPTYTLHRNEAYSPRGRIALIQQLATHGAVGDKRYLDSCLHCLSCEAMCPANVPYGDMITTARRALPPAIGWRWLIRLGEQRWWQRLLVVTLRALPHRQRLWRRVLPAFVGRIVDAVPVTVPTRPAVVAATAPSAPTVRLFSGCSAPFDQQTISDARQLLVHCGYQVLDHPAGCCGALAAHNGMLPPPLPVAGTDDVPTAVVATGCLAHLRSTASGYDDVLSLLLPRLNTAAFTPLDTTVAVYTPCTARYPDNMTAVIEQALALIPGLRWQYVTGSGCCGGAGINFLRRPADADPLANTILDALPATIDTLITSNVGCALHLRGAARRRGRSLRIIHPVTLLLAQARTACG